MPNQPTRQEVHINRPLTQISTAYIQNDKYFVHDKVFKTIPVVKQSDLYFKYLKEYWFRTEAMPRAAGTESAGGGFRLSTGQYLARKWAYHIDIDDDTRQNADDPLDMDRDGTALVMRKLLLRREKLWLSTYMAPNVWTGLTVGNNVYDFNPQLTGAGTGGAVTQYGYGNGAWNTSVSNPILDVDNLIVAGMSQTGEMANTMTVTIDVHMALKNNPAVIERIKYGDGNSANSPAVATEVTLAKVFGVDNYYIAGAVINSAQEGQTGVYGFMKSNSMLLSYVPPAPAILTPAPGYIFAWTGLLGAGALGSRIKKFRMENLESDRIEGTMAFDMNLVGADLSIYGTNLLQ